MNLETIMDLDEQYFMHVFGKRVPVAFERGEGMALYDKEGKKYYDFLAGIAVNALGHSHPRFIAALKDQLDAVIHTSNYYYVESQAKLAEKIASSSVADKVFFANSGAEANEGAIKLARFHAKKKGYSDKYEIVTLLNSFHGRTLATVAATGQEKFQKPCEPLTPGFRHVPMNDLSALREAVTDRTCAIMLELIQGESGVNPATQEFVDEVVKCAKAHDALVIVDEVQTGMGRTGKLFCYEHYGIEPDIFTLAKALGNGIPIGAVCAKDEVAASFAPGDHGSTFGGNAFATTAGLSVMNIMEEENLIENSEKMGTYFKEKLLSLGSPKIETVRGKGLMLGVVLTEDLAPTLKHQLFEAGFLVGAVGNRVLRLLPPLIVTTEEIDLFVKALGSLL